MKKKKKLSDMLMTQSGMGRLRKPSLNVTATVDSYGSPMMHDPHMLDFHRREAKRLHGEIKVMDKHIAGWDPNTVAAQALKSLKVERASKHARLAESRAHIAAYAGPKSKKKKGNPVEWADAPEDSEKEEAAEEAEE